jgi:hypothetical protein
MRLKDHLREGLQSWRPKKYRSLLARKQKSILVTAGVWLACSLVLMVLVAIPGFWSLQRSLEEQLSSFETFSVETNITLREPLTLLSSPLVIIAPEQENLTREQVLVNDEGIVIKKPLGGTKTVLWSTVLDVQGNAGVYASWLRWSLALLLPTIILIVAGLFVVQACVLVISGTIIGFLVSKIARFSLSPAQLLKITTLATIPLMTLQIAPLFYVRWWAIPIGLWVFLVIIASWIVGEGRQEHKHRS